MSLKLVLLLGLTLGPLQAGELTLPEALRLAAQGSFKAEEARLERSKAREETKQVRSLYLPEVQLSLGHLNLDNQPALQSGPFTVGPMALGGVTVPAFSFGPLVTPMGDTSSWRGKLSVQYLLYDFGKRSSALAAARSKEEAQGLKNEGEVRNLQAEVAARYMTLLYLKAQHQVLVERRRALEDHLKTARDLYEQGVVARNDLLRTEVALRSLGDAERALNNSETGAREALNTSMGLDPRTPLLVADNPALPSGLPWSEGECRNRAARENESVKALRAKTRALEDQTALRRADWTPNLVTEGFHSYEQNSYSLHPHETGLYVGLSWKVFDGARASKVRQSESELDLSRREVLEAERQAGNAAAVAWREFRQALQEMGTAEANVTASEENLRIVEDQYREGLVQGGEALDAEALLADSRFSLAARRHRACTQQAALLALLGADLPAFYESPKSKEL